MISAIVAHSAYKFSNYFPKIEAPYNLDNFIIISTSAARSKTDQKQKLERFYCFECLVALKLKICAASERDRRKRHFQRNLWIIENFRILSVDDIFIQKA